MSFLDAMPPSGLPAATPSLSRNQQQKRARREKAKLQKQQMTNELTQSDSLCARLTQALADAQALLTGQFRASFIGPTPQEDASEASMQKKRRTDVCGHSISAASSSSSCPSVCVSSVALGSSGLLARIPRDATELLTAVVIDQARQIQASYESHRITAEGNFTAGPVRHDAAAVAERQEAPSCACQLFRLDAPYQLTAAAATPTAASAEAATVDPQPTGPASPLSSSLYRNGSASDLVVEHAGRRHVMPPRSTALLGDISLASEIVAKLRPASGFQLIVMDPPWQSKSVRRSRRYESLDHRLLSHLPLASLLSPAVPCFVCVWVTNNPLFHAYVRDTLFPLWGLRHEATWTWLKCSDDGRMVLPLHPTADTKHRKPYEQLLIGWRGEGPRSGAASSIATETGSASVLPASFPRSLTLLSVPGSKHHSRKPQLGELFAPYLSSSGACLELFARNLIAGWSSWGDQAILFQQCDDSVEAADGRVGQA